MKKQTLLSLIAGAAVVLASPVILAATDNLQSESLTQKVKYQRGGEETKGENGDASSGTDTEMMGTKPQPKKEADVQKIRYEHEKAIAEEEKKYKTEAQKIKYEHEKALAEEELEYKNEAQKIKYEHEKAIAAEDLKCKNEAQKIKLGPSEPSAEDLARCKTESATTNTEGVKTQKIKGEMPTDQKTLKHDRVVLQNEAQQAGANNQNR